MRSFDICIFEGDDDRFHSIKKRKRRIKYCGWIKKFKRKVNHININRAPFENAITVVYIYIYTKTMARETKDIDRKVGDDK